MKRRIRDNDRALGILGLLLLAASLLLSASGDEAGGVALFEIGGMLLGLGVYLHVTRYI